MGNKKPLLLPLSAVSPSPAVHRLAPLLSLLPIEAEQTAQHIIVGLARVDLQGVQRGLRVPFDGDRLQLRHGRILARCNALSRGSEHECSNRDTIGLTPGRRSSGSHSSGRVRPGCGCGSDREARRAVTRRASGILGGVSHRTPLPNPKRFSPPSLVRCAPSVRINGTSRSPARRRRRRRPARPATRRTHRPSRQKLLSHARRALAALSMVARQAAPPTRRGILTIAVLAHRNARWRRRWACRRTAKVERPDADHSAAICTTVEVRRDPVITSR